MWNSYKGYFWTAELIVGTSLAIKTVSYGWLMIPIAYLYALPIASLVFLLGRYLRPPGQ